MKVEHAGNPDEVATLDMACKAPLPHSGNALARSTWLLALLAFGVYCTYSITKQWTGYTSGYDLGIFSQIVERYAHFQAPDVGIKLNWDALGDHFSPALALIAPIYRVFPSPTTLLVVQAGLSAISIVPVVRAASAVFSRSGSLLVGAAYATSYGIQGMISFDFHEVALAVPLLAFGLERYLRGRLLQATLFLCPIVFVKEDLGLTLGIFGLLMVVRGHRILGAGILAWSAGWFWLATAVIIPSLNGSHSYRYFSHFKQNGALSSFSPSGLWQLVTTDGRLHLLFMLLVTGVVVSLRSPLIALTLGTLSWRLLSVGPQYMTTRAHYDAVLMPIVFLALIDGVGRLRPWSCGRRLVQLVPTVALAVAISVTVAGYPFSSLISSSFYYANSRVAAVATLSAHVPRGAEIRTDNHLAPLLVSHYRVYLMYETYPNLPVTSWVMLDDSVSSLNASLSWKKRYVRSLEPYVVAQYQDANVVLLQLAPHGGQAPPAQPISP